MPGEMIGLTGTQSRGTPLGGSWPHPVRVHAQGWQNRGSRRTARSVLLAPRSIVEGNTRPANREWSTWHPKQSGTPILKTSIASSKNDDGSAADDDPSIGSDERAMPPVGDPVGVVAWGGKLPSTRRMVVGGLAGVSIALVSNFLGVTSLLLSASGGSLARSLRLDVLVPVSGFKRCYDSANGFEFVVPTEWLADQTIFRRAAARAERSIDPPALRQRRPRQTVSEPIAGFGPAGNKGDTNMSVIVAPILPGFKLEDMGGSEKAAGQLLENIAPPGSSRVATLLSSSQSRGADGVLYYTMEYTVKGPSFFRHNISKYAAAADTLYTYNAVCPEDRWDTLKVELLTSAESFRLVGGS